MIRSRSTKRRRREEAATAARWQVLAAAGGDCQIRPILAAAVRSYPREVTEAEGLEIDVLMAALRACRGRAEGVHERRKRSAQGSLDDPRNLVACCNPCNGWVEDRPTLAHDLGLVVRPGDPEWEELAR